ncbi:MAG: CHAT domain-containing protein [Spirulinaceae cyanobacterium]
MLKTLLWMGSGLILPFALTAPAFAQSITAAPDGTGTIITIDGQTYHIDGGTQAGANLFHSFQDFGLSQGEIANFLSNPSVSNIFGRVVGGNASIIDGLIQANPNLYLMNPAGIVFGANASLNVGGDFFATTADQICFEGGCFNSVGLNDYRALAGSPTTLGFLQSQPGGVINAGTLAVLKGKSIHLSGGTVVNLGQILAPGGMATVAAIPGERRVQLNQPGNLLSLEVTDEVLTEGINPLTLPELLTGSGRDNPPMVAPNPAGVSTGALPLQNSDNRSAGTLPASDQQSNVVINGDISAQQIDLYAAGQVTPSDTNLIEGDTRVVRFSEAGENPDQAVFIDRRADNPETLLYGAAAGTVSQIIERDENGVAVISEHLSAIADSVGELESAAIIAEGNQGNFWLGNQWIRNENIADYAAQLQTWGKVLTANADILLYSCFTALGATGEALVASIADLTGADVAASVDATSSVNYGGDWSLESSTGAIEANTPFTSETLASWEGKLANRTVTTADDLSSTNSLRNAIEGGGGIYTSAAGAGDRIEFNIAGSPTITLSGEISWSVDDLTIDGSNITGDVVVDGGGANRVFNISGNNTTIQNLTIRNGSTAGRGGGIYSPTGNITLTNSTVSGNSANLAGGGVYTRSGDITLNNSTVSGNSANVNTPLTFSGGGLYSNSGTITVTDSRVINNSGSTRGGGIYNHSGNTILSNSTVSGNSAADAGGGISSLDGDITISNGSDIANNISYRGGGITAFRGNVILSGSTISGNSTSSWGGGMYAAGGDIDVSNSTIAGNTSGRYGGGIYSLYDTGSITVLNSTISGNSATGGGGGIYGNGSFTLSGSNVSGNTAAYGGGINIRLPFGSNTPVNITNSTITGNAATSDSGGGLRISDADLTIENSAITNNSASTTGGGLALARSQATLINSTLTGNQAASSDQGDGVHLFRSTVTLQNDGDLYLSDSIAAANGTNSGISLTGQSVVLAVPIQSNGADITIDAQQNVQALTADATLSSAGTTGGNITITAGSDVQLRNVLAFGRNDDGGNISITSTGGSATTTFGGSEGVLNSTSFTGGNAGNITVNATGTLTLGKIFAEGLGVSGAGGTVNLASDSLVQVTGTGTQGFDTASISTVGNTAGGNIIIQHGGLGLIPFTIGDASRNGTAGSLSTGTGSGQTLSPVQSFLYNFSQGGIQILTNADSANAYSEITLFPLPGSNPPALEFYGESPEQLFLKLIAAQVDGEITIDEEGNIATLEIRDEAAQLEFELTSNNNETLANLLNSEDGLDIAAIDELLENEYVENEVGKTVTLVSIRETFATIEQQTGTRPALIYALSTPDALELILITPQDNEPLIHKVVPGGDRATLRRTIRTFRRRLTGVSNDYFTSAQQLYDWLIRPLESSIDNLNIDTLIFAMGEGLRSIPMAALHDGEQFLIEKYSLGQIPSLSLTDSNYEPLHNANVLAMGASQFEQLTPLPAVPNELTAVTTIKSGEQYLNQGFTWNNLKTQSRSRDFEIVHLATHAAFRPGSATNSYIQLWGNEQIGVDQLRELRWFEDPKVELLVLSACETALGDPYAELGFAGLAVQSGVKSTLASLWQVSDLGTMRLMNGFYQQLNNSNVTIKAEALRQAQLALLRGEVNLQSGFIGETPLPPELARYANTDLTHPFYWSGFTLVGSPW